MVASICAGPECDRSAVARGLCGGHLKQQYRDTPLRPLRPVHLVVEGHKVCHTCMTRKPVAEFYDRGDGQPMPSCRECFKARQKHKGQEVAA